MVSFRDKPLTERKIDVMNVLRKYPERIPVCVYKNSGCKLNDLAKDKYLVPRNTTVGQFLFSIRKFIDLKPTEALFLFFGNGQLTATHTMMGEIYDQYKNKEDGMLYAVYSAENTFG
jgi:GABA(A) receptor-associated protein